MTSGGENFDKRDVEIFAVGKIAESPKFSGEEDSSLQTAFPYTSWPKAGMLLMGGLLTLCWSLRKHNDNSPIPNAH